MAKKKERVYREDCFGYIDEFKCSALKKIDCGECSFYKTSEQYKKELLKYNGMTDLDKIVELEKAKY